MISQPKIRSAIDPARYQNYKSTQEFEIRNPLGYLGNDQQKSSSNTNSHPLIGPYTRQNYVKSRKNLEQDVIANNPSQVNFHNKNISDQTTNLTLQKDYTQFNLNKTNTSIKPPLSMALTPSHVTANDSKEFLTRTDTLTGLHSHICLTS